MKSPLLILLLLIQPWFSLSFSWTLFFQKRTNLLVEVAPARFPQDLPQIQSCRKTAFGGGALRSPQLSFVNAEAAVQGRAVCIVARERLPPFAVLGTADLRNNDYVNNVFVLSEARGLGLAKLLMKKAEEISDSSSLSLDVETSNKAALGLYKKLGYEAKGIHAVSLAIGQATGTSLLVSMTKSL